MPDAVSEPVRNTMGLKSAVALAIDFCRQIYPATTASNILVEEIDEKSDGSGWLVTLGFDTTRIVRPPAPFFTPALPREEMTRIYKTFMVDSQSGRVVSMKIRESA